MTYKSARIWAGYDRCEDCGARRGAACRDLNDKITATVCKGRPLRTSIVPARADEVSIVKRLRADIARLTTANESLSTQLKEAQRRLAAIADLAKQ